MASAAASGSKNRVVGMSATTATGAMYISRLRLSIRSLESDSMIPCGGPAGSQVKAGKVGTAAWLNQMLPS